MSLSQTLDVAIGLIVVYYLLGSVVSLITQLINETLETRGKALRQHIVRLVGESKIGDFIQLPQIQALRPIRYKNLLSVFSAATEPKMVEKIPVSTMVDSFFDFSGLTEKGEMQAQELIALLNNLPDSEAKRAFLTWANQGVTSLRDLRLRATDYFNGVLEQAAATFRARARSFVIMLSIAITLLFGTDTIQLAQNLWQSADLRAIAAAQAQAVVAQEGPQMNIDDLAAELEKYSIKIGWWQTQKLPATGNPADWAYFLFLKTLGLSITAMAVSQGSSFWYDLLKKVTNPGKALSSPASVSSGGESDRNAPKG